LPKRKIAILGGGIAGLTAAYYLTRTESLRAKHAVTLYQIGWRLGGKGATGRRDGRIEEHGLHVWFGFYDNAFRMLREVYRDWVRDSDNPLQSWRDALKPQAFTPIGPDFLPFNWPANAGVPGDGHLCWTPWQAFTELLGLVTAVIEDWHEERERQGQAHSSPVTVSADVTAHLRQTQAGANLAGRTFANTHHALAAATQWARSFGPTHHGPHNHHLPSLVALLHQTHQSFLSSLPAAGADAGQAAMSDVLDLFYGFANGFVYDFLIDGKTAREVDAQEFRAWLIAHGTSRAVAADSFIARALYDTMFQYEEGDLARPSYAAGTSVQVILRLFGTYKGTGLWEMQAGMGEVIVAPIYQLLKARGVAFQFFRDVTKLALDADRTHVAEIHLTRQADPIGAEYQPTFKCGGMDCWPAEPFWDQLENGPALRAARVDFESPWSQYQPAGHDVLEHGVHFDDVVLAISLGVFKRLNADPTLADELSAANPAFKTMTEKIGLVPSMALQIWSPRTLGGLGWRCPKPATVAGVEPLDIWADMSQALRFEGWQGDTKPQSVHYFTGVMHTTAYRNPRSAHATQRESEAELTKICESWLSEQGPRIWSDAVTSDGRFDWYALWAAAGLHGPERLSQQYIRANVSPTECCPGSAAGTTQYRLKAGDSGFANLTLAGCWIDTGFNTTCIEGAVMSGMEASRAICGAPAHVIGEHFLQVPGHGLGVASAPVRMLEEIVHFIEGGVVRIAQWLSGAREERQ
jgi:uncharacterized protein with NAD-binding domain and iron-sulfur cluster